MTEPALLLRDLSVTLHRGSQGRRVLDRVTIEVRPGEVVALVGESGSGKSTIGLAAQGLLPAEARPAIEGSVRVAGTEVAGAPPAVLRDVRRRLVRAVPQDPLAALDPLMRVGRQLAEGAAPGEDPADWLPRVGLPDVARVMRAWPHELSGGQRQRVLIASAMMARAPLIVADEPTTALDVTVQAQILDLLGVLARERGTAVLFITHDLGVAAAVARRLVVLYAGRVAEAGDAGDVLRAPRHPYARALLAARFDLDADRTRPLPVAPGEPPAGGAERPGCAFAPRCPLALDLCRAETPALRPLPGAAGATTRLAACHRVEAAAAAAPPAARPWPDARMGAATALRLAGVRLAFHGRTVLDGLDLVVREGEAVALVGISGSGKSTILRLAAGLLRPDAGQVEARGRPQMVFQDAHSSLTPWLPVGEQVAERLRPLRLSRSERDARVAEALRLVGLTAEAARALPRELSGGQAQRAAVARAVVVPPDLLLCDEPISAMDVSLAAQALNLLGDLRRRLGLGMVFVTHDLAAARIVADRLVVLEAGRVVEDGPADEIAARPASAHARELLAATPRLREAAA